MKFSIALVRAVGFFGVLAIIVLSLVPGANRPHTGLPGAAEHFIAYCLAALALTLGFWSIVSRIAIASGLTLLAASMEILQLWVPGRHPAFMDAAASSLGALLGIAFGQIFLYLAIQACQRVA
jgi:VanZ family protein